MTERYPLRSIVPDEFAAFCEPAVQAFNDADFPAEAIEHERIVFEFDRSLAAFDGDTIVGTTAAYSFQLTVPGGIVDAGGVTFVAVRPSHRRRGILSAMMRHQLADIAGRGEPVAALFASETGIYGRYGYGCASGQLSLTIRRGEGALAPAAASSTAAGSTAAGSTGTGSTGTGSTGTGSTGTGSAGTGHGPVRLREVPPAELRAELAKVYDSVLPHRPGMMARDERWWENVLADLEFFRRGRSRLKCLLAGDESAPRGYALYRTKPDWDDDGLPSGRLTVRELIAADAGATAALWADLLTRDLIGEVAAGARPVDDPLLDMLADRRRARAYLTDGLWVRLTDVPAALRRRRYAAAADVVIEVTDDLLPANAGRWRLRCPGPADGGTPSCERTTAAADIALPVAALGAGYLGGTRLGALAAAGLISERTPGTLTRLSAAMHSDPAPWCPSMF
jgi:predicted acetyltransferase